MAHSIWWRIALVGISCYLVAAPVRADRLRMECWVADSFTGKSIGEYAFLFDTASGSLSVTAHPRDSSQSMFGQDAETWKLLLAQGGHAVFYYITDDTTAQQIAGRVRILSLNFEKPNMFNYWMGGELDESKIPPYKTDCRRLN